MADENIARMKLAIVFQFTYPGIPYIYYGDEVGMIGGFDPDCRRCMIWDENNQNKDIYNFYKKLILIRKDIEELRYGDIKTLYAKDSVIAFERRYSHKITTIVINNSDRSLKVPSQYFKNKEEILGMSSYQLDDKYAILESNSAYILK
jgi:glycosidase